jgi:beta-N-acetylhexosaminidase
MVNKKALTYAKLGLANSNLTSLIFFLLLLTSCNKPLDTENIHSENIKTGENTLLKKKYTIDDFYGSNEELDKVVNQVMKHLTLREKVSQMVFTSIGDKGRSEKQALEILKEGYAGGVMLFADDKAGLLSKTKSITQLSAQYGVFPILVSIDAEPSLVNGRIREMDNVVPDASSISHASDAYNTGSYIATEMIRAGIHWNYAPVCDNGQNKSVIGNRAFSENPATIIELSKAFISGTQNEGVIATAKHFPGHGLVEGDTHKGKVSIKGKLQELPVFKNILNAGVLSVMVGHISITENEYNTGGKPATFSRYLVSELLRNSLGFQGVILTDAMNMEAVSKYTNASLQAILAGCDIVLMPKNEKKLQEQIIMEIAKSTSFAQQVENSVRRIIRLKICAGLLSSEWLQKEVYTGYIFGTKRGDLPITMTIRNQKGDINGTYKYDGTNIMLNLEGVINDKRIYLTEYAPTKGLESGTFNGEWRNRREIVGTWQSHDKQRDGLKFRLKRK